MKIHYIANKLVLHDVIVEMEVFEKVTMIQVDIEQLIIDEAARDVGVIEITYRHGPIINSQQVIEVHLGGLYLFRCSLLLAEGSELEHSVIKVSYCKLVAGDILLNFFQLNVVPREFFLKVLNAIINSPHFDFEQLARLFAYSYNSAGVIQNHGISYRLLTVAVARHEQVLEYILVALEPLIRLVEYIGVLRITGLLEACYLLLQGLFVWLDIIF